MKKISELRFLEVVAEDGRPLGRVMDFRCAGDPEHGNSRKERMVSELTYGISGLLELLGLRQVEVKRVPWKAVRRIENGKIVIDERS